VSIAVVDTELCMGCGLCKDLCPYEGTVTIEDRKSNIDESRCRGCGLCVAACPAMALDLKYLPRKMIFARTKAFLRGEGTTPTFEPKLMIYICDWLSRKGASLRDVAKIPGSSKVRAIKFPCIGFLDPLFVVNAFLSGADGVLIVGCGKDDCDHVDSNLKASLGIKYVLSWLKTVGLEEERLKFQLLPLSKARSEFMRIAADALTTIKEIGPTLLR